MVDDRRVDAVGVELAVELNVGAAGRVVGVAAAREKFLFNVFSPVETVRGERWDGFGFGRLRFDCRMLTKDVIAFRRSEN